MIQPSPFAKPRRWLSAYDPGVPESIEYPVIPIYRPLMDVAARHPGETALLDRSEPVTYKELVWRIEALAAALARLGVGKGGHVGIYLPNCPEIVVSYYGVMRDGWLYTGDIAWMDYDGYFFVIDRMKDLVIAGAFKAYPAEVEAVLRTHLRIKEAAVAGLFDDFRGHSLKAFVVLEESAGLTEDEVLSFCRENLSGHKVPRAVEFRDELPKSEMGKILRKELE